MELHHKETDKSLADYIARVSSAEGINKDSTDNNGGFAIAPREIFVTKDGRRIPCANRATLAYYKTREELWFHVV